MFARTQAGWATVVRCHALESVALGFSRGVALISLFEPPVSTSGWKEADLKLLWRRPLFPIGPLLDQSLPLPLAKAWIERVGFFQKLFTRYPFGMFRMRIDPLLISDRLRTHPQRTLFASSMAFFSLLGLGGFVLYRPILANDLWCSLLQGVISWPTGGPTWMSFR